MGLNLGVFSVCCAISLQQGENPLACLVMSYFEFFGLSLVAAVILIDNVPVLYIPRSKTVSGMQQVLKCLFIQKIFDHLLCTWHFLWYMGMEDYFLLQTYEYLLFPQRGYNSKSRVNLYVENLNCISKSLYQLRCGMAQPS